MYRKRAGRGAARRRLTERPRAGSTRSTRSSSALKTTMTTTTTTTMMMMTTTTVMTAATRTLFQRVARRSRGARRRAAQGGSARGDREAHRRRWAVGAVRRGPAPRDRPMRRRRCAVCVVARVDAPLVLDSPVPRAGSSSSASEIQLKEGRQPGVVEVAHTVTDLGQERPIDDQREGQPLRGDIPAHGERVFEELVISE